MNVLYIVSDTEKEYNSANWRCDMPIETINKTKEHHAQKLFIKDWVESPDQTLSHWADVIVLQRNVVAGGMWTVGEWMARGKTVLVDLDDGYEYMPQSNISAGFWINNQTVVDGKVTALPFAPLEHLKMGLKLCSAITTPSEVIVNDRKSTNKTILVPNYPKVDMYIEAARRYNEKVMQNDRILLGWGGGGSHFDSFMMSGVVPAIVRVLEKRKNVDVLIMGPKELGQVLTNKDKRLFSRVKTEPWGKYEEWPDRLARLDVAIAPLHGNYDKRRSWLKAIEYTLCGIPWVGTNYGENPQPYGAFPAYHLVRNQAKYWEEALLDTIDNLADAKKLMKQEQEWARQFDLFSNAENIIGAYVEAQNG